MKLPFDPIERAREVERIVMINDKRKYYRFRTSKYYGGIVTADAVGCCFLCAYCWNYQRNLKPERHGKFYSSEEVKKRLNTIANKSGLSLFRISGAEPILGNRSFEHLLRILDIGEFIIETNGLILGFYPELIDKLAEKDVYVRISIKGWDENSFERISGAKKEYFTYQIKALKELTEAGVEAWPAVMLDVFKKEGVGRINEVFEREGIQKRLEFESLETYPFVIRNM
jgi:uncharacterized Fe-S cluster-containing radical SAM superfamily protein